MTSFDALSLAEPLSRALNDLGHTTPTPIQTQAIPPALQGRDVMGIAQTGTGKTAGFALPALHKIFTEDLDPPKRGARVLILAPTRELAGQIAESVRSYGRHMMQLSVACVYGGVPIARQIKRLTGGNDVLVATPGRLVDLVERKAIKLGEVDVLILDEADQMLDMGFIHTLKKIITFIPKERQTLFFSATLAPKIKNLSKQFLTDPVHVSVTPANRTAEKITQHIIRLPREEKQGRLAVELLRPDVGRSLVFTRTKHGADRVVKRLAKMGIAAVAIHGNKNQNQRIRALEAFKSGAVNTLIATDVAARGIDIPDITHVFNYELPNVPEQYVHRIGRTARAAASGIAISFIATDKGSDERKYLKDIEKLLKDSIPEGEAPEDLAAELKALKTRKALPKPEKPKQEPRSGRGKSRKKKKARFSKDRVKKAARGQTPSDRNSSAEPKVKSKTEPKAKSKGTSGKPAGNSSTKRPPKTGSKPAHKKSGKASHKPKRMTGESSTEVRSRKPKTEPSKSAEQAPNKNPARKNPSRKNKPSGKNKGGQHPPKRRKQNRDKKPKRQ